MKVAVTCDALIERTATISIVESVLETLEDAEVFTIVHHAGKILGPIEQTRIRSTYLTNMITEERAFGDQWWKKSVFIPGACKNLFIPCSFDLVINISSGFSQGIKKCESTKQITYLVDNVFKKRKSHFLREKIFRKYLESWSTKAFSQADELWVMNEKEREYWSELHDNVSIVSPYFKATDYPFFPEATRKSFPNDFLCLDAESLNEEEASSLITRLKEASIKYKFIGNDSHLSRTKKSVNDEDFWGARCSGELAPLMAASRGLISLQKFGFPTLAVQCLSTGTPIWLPSESEGHDYVNGPGVFGKEVSLDNITSIFDQMTGLELKKVHGQTTKFHDIKFKGELKRRLARIY